MSIADLPISMPSHWNWLEPICRVRNLLIVFLLVGLLSFAAVLTITLQLDCRDGETFLTDPATGALLTDEQGRLLVTGQKQKRCWLADSVESLPWWH
jgi:hypothetical protein